MKQKVVEESIPQTLLEVAKRRDELSNRLGCNNLLDFLCDFGCDGNKLQNS